MKRKIKWIQRSSWKQFRQAGMLWWVNRILHIFGWALVVDLNKDGSIVGVYPAKCRYRGFCEKVEGEGYKKVTRYMQKHIKSLMRDVLL